jgi:hypothetical protein
MHSSGYGGTIDMAFSRRLRSKRGGIEGNGGSDDIQELQLCLWATTVVYLCVLGGGGFESVGGWSRRR